MLEKRVQTLTASLLVQGVAPDKQDDQRDNNQDAHRTNSVHHSVIVVAEDVGTVQPRAVHTAIRWCACAPHAVRTAAVFAAVDLVA